LGGANLFFGEDIAYQKAASQEMERRHASCRADETSPRQAQSVAGRSTVHTERHGSISMEAAARNR